MDNQSAIQERQPLLNRYYITAIFINVAVGVMLQCYNNTIALHIHAKGFGTTLTGAMISIGAMTAFFYRIFGGRITDRFGRRNTMLLGIALFAVMNGLCGIVPSVWLLLLCRLVQMFGYAMASTSVAVMVVDVTPRSRMTEGIGYFGLGQSLSQAVAPAAAVALFATALAFRAVMLFTVAVGAVGLVLTAALCNYERDPNFFGNRIAAMQEAPAPRQKRTFSQFFWDFIERAALPAMFVALCSTMAACLITMFLTHYAKVTGIANGGLFFTCSAIAMVAARLGTGRLADRFGPLSCIVPGFLMNIAALMGLLFCSELPLLFYLSGVLYGFGSGMSGPALNAAAVRAAPAERRSAASSTFLLQADIGFMFGSLLWGAMIDMFGYRPVYLMAAGVTVLGLILAVIFFRKKK